jgi:hypothetical protein
MRKARSLKENMIATQLDQAMRRFIGPKPEQVSTCVLDDILRRELKMAEKENRKPAYKSRTIFDEVNFRRLVPKGKFLLKLSLALRLRDGWC